MTTNKYHAFWHYCSFFGSRGAVAISEKPETLLKLHEDNIKNPDSCWHNYKHNVSEIKVEPIECYTYNNVTKKLEPYNDSHIADDYEFYAVNSLSGDDFGVTLYNDVIIKVTDSDGNFLDDDDFDDLDKGEFLVYLSKNDYNKWMELHELYTNYDIKDNFIMDPDVPSFFYLTWTSHDPVLPDVYYEEGLMNA